MVIFVVSVNAVFLVSFKCIGFGKMRRSSTLEPHKDDEDTDGTDSWGGPDTLDED